MAARAAGAIRPKGGVAGFGFVLARRADLRRFLGLKLGLPAYARRGALSEPFPMLSVNIPRGAKLERIVVAPDGEIPEGAVWLDFLSRVRPKANWCNAVVFMAPT
jgi:hypothetical protein